MTEPSRPGTGAGALLRAAREKQGLHVAALAASLKISPRKLEALEGDRFDELPDATFTRALALTVCRALKIDSGPVLAQLPSSGAAALANAGGLNTPFRERPGRSDPADLRMPRQPMVWAAAVVMLAAGVVYFLPDAWWEGLLPAAAPAASAAVPSAASAPAAAGAPARPAAPSASAASGAEAAAPAAFAPAAVAAAPASASGPTVEVVHSAPPADPGASASAAGLVVLRTVESSWIEVTEAGGQVLVQRVLQPGESLGLDGKLPMKLKIGNAAATQLSFRGQPFDLAPQTRDNVARLELK
jgi:cytoskeleton protein RodZ